MTQTDFRLEQLDTPTGRMLVVTDGDGVLRAADWETHTERLHRLLARHYGPKATLMERPSAPSKAAVAFKAYFAGELSAIDDVEAKTAGTAFQREVWAALRTIPSGETLSYGQLAARIGKPKAVRAVGLANGQNPVSIIVPCHRVIGANGSMTGYGGGVERKSWLLEHERGGPPR